MAQPISSALARARELAQKKRQPMSTAHVLVALFQSHREIAELCNGIGFTEQSLVAALNAAPEEPASGVDLAVERAKKLASKSGRSPNGEPKALHLLLSLVREARSSASQGLLSTGLSPEKLATAARDALTEPPLEPSLPSEPPVASRRTEHRWGRSREPRLDRFRSFALSKETESKLARTRTEQVDVVQTRSAEPAREAGPAQPAKSAPEQLTLTPQARTTTKTGRARAARAARQKVPAPEVEVSWTLDEQRFPLLHSVARNLTQLAASGQIDPVIGRDADIERLLDVLARRRGNNPLLVGAPGVGKTAVVEGLALALVEQARRGKTHGKREPFILLEVAASSLLAGTGVRGALSERIQTLRKEVAESGRVLLFIDEIHGVLGGVEGDGLGSELKTALARGELPVIGATTDAEYRRIFQRDAALARRFTRIEVSEPSRADTLQILKGIVPQYSTHHAVKYTPDALEAAIDLSVRYMPLRQLPDKAIGLVDQAAARVRRSGDTVVDRVAIARVVSELVQVPVDRLLMEDREALLSLEEQLAARVVGQTRAIEAISHALRRSAAGFRGQRPLGTFLFAGPTGVGKTEMAKAIAEVLFPGIPMTRVDMSELAQSHGVARLLGAPPGYIGHEDGGQLTEAVRHRPYQLVLLDEIEKAHMQVLLALLPLLDEGRLTDGRGRTVDFTNTVIVMTSNLGIETSSKGRIGFGDARLTASDYAPQVLSRVRAALPPELWNRIDEPLCFLPLVESELSEIARRMLRAVGELAHAKHGVKIEVQESAIALLLRLGGFDAALGARPMRRTVSRFVEAPLAQALLAGQFKAGDTISVAAAAEAIELSRL